MNKTDDDDEDDDDLFAESVALNSVTVSSVQFTAELIL